MIQFPSIPERPLNCREALMQVWPDIFPGIDRVVLLYNHLNGDLGGEELILVDKQYRRRNVIGSDRLLRKDAFLNAQPGYNWIHKDQLPFEGEQQMPGQLQIFSEFQHVVLHIKMRFEDGIDHYFLFFREDQSNFGIHRIQGALDTGRKALIGSIVYRFMRTFYQTKSRDIQYVEQFTGVVRSVLNGNGDGSVSKEEEKRLWVSEWAEDFLVTLSEKHSVNLQLSKDALEKLISCGSFKKAKEGLIKAAGLVIMLNTTTNEGNELLIHSQYLNLDGYREHTPNTSSENFKPKGRLARTKLLLDNLEQAAAELYSRGDDITGASVGQMLKRPVSAPAITDALRKNSERILRLLNKFPDKWPLIREQFRPLVNLVEKSVNMRGVG
ncbi:hypothetical protein [Natronoflexus pectinivorans]|nr:hypothetical protein [Natronoflexus pectinivorans]